MTLNEGGCDGQPTPQRNKCVRHTQLEVTYTKKCGVVTRYSGNLINIILYPFIIFT